MLHYDNKLQNELNEAAEAHPDGVSAALNELEGNGVDIGEPSKFYSDKAQPKLSSSNGITWK